MPIVINTISDETELFNLPKGIHSWNLIETMVELFIVTFYDKTLKLDFKCICGWPGGIEFYKPEAWNLIRNYPLNLSAVTHRKTKHLQYFHRLCQPH